MDYGDTAALSATLTDASGAPLVNRTVAFSLSDHRCTGVTDGSGSARCPVTANLAPGPYTVVAAFGGDSAYAPATTSTTFTVVPEETRLTYTGDTNVSRGGTVNLSAILADDEGQSVSARLVTFTLSGRPGTQTWR